MKAAAQARLAAMVDPALARLSELLAQKRDMKVALGAAKDILDRNDLSGEQKVAARLTVERVFVELPVKDDT